MKDKTLAMDIRNCELCPSRMMHPDGDEHCALLTMMTSGEYAWLPQSYVEAPLAECPVAQGRVIVTAKR